MLKSQFRDDLVVKCFDLAKDFLRIKVCLCKKCCYLDCKSLASVLIALNSCIDGLIVRGGVGLRRGIRVVLPKSSLSANKRCAWFLLSGSRSICKGLFPPL